MIKRAVGDILSLITSNNDEDYEPSKSEYWMFGIICIVIIAFIFGMSF
jgi:hypothetical protein